MKNHTFVAKPTPFFGQIVAKPTPFLGQIEPKSVHIGHILVQYGHISNLHLLIRDIFCIDDSPYGHKIVQTRLSFEVFSLGMSLD